jgi:hypothetical protein
LTEGVQYGHRVAPRVRDLVQVCHQPRADSSSTGFWRDPYGRDASHADALSAEPGLQGEQKAVCDEDSALLENPQVVEGTERVVAQMADAGVVASCVWVRVRVNRDEPVDVLRARLA